jgi:tripartite-type tricarboxylate transporter receptor subunit TctC
MKTFSRRRFAGTLLSLGVAAPWTLRAQPRLEMLRVVCGYPPGGSVDIVCRKLAERLAGGRFAAQAVVENKPGAAGRLAVDDVKKATPDGSAVLVTPASVMTMYPHVFRQLSYDPFTDLAPVSAVAATGFALAVGPRVPATVTTIDDFARWCRANPAAAQCGNAGAGSMPHLMALLLQRETRVEITHVPYRGGSASMQAVAAGEVSSALATEGSARSLVQAGRLRVLATSGADRSPFFPQTATFREQGLPHLTRREWYGAFVPARTPAGTVQDTAEALRAVLQEQDVRNAWEQVSLVVESNSPAQLLATMRTEHEFWGELVKATGFTPEA